MRWITNTCDPNRARLKGKTIGRPKASEVYTVEQLEEMGIGGIYVEEDDSNFCPTCAHFSGPGYLTSTSS